MKTIKIILALLLASIFFTACGSDAADEGIQNDQITEQGTLIPGFDISQRPLSSSEALIVGMYRLEGTPFEVSAAQAAELQPLWQVLSNLVASDIAAQEEITALLDQITETYTDEQVQAIEDMQLVQQDLSDLMEELGIESTFGRLGNFESEDGGAPPQRPGGFGEGSGGVPGQGFGGRPGGGGQDLSPDEIATLRAERETAGGAFGSRRLFNPELLNAFIEFLQGKAGA